MPITQADGSLQVYRYVSGGEVIYVGMGKPGRAEHHLKACFWGKKTPFYNKLRKLISAGSCIEIEIMLECDSRDHAALKEQEFIALYGRRHLGGTLWNVAAGGQGCSLDGAALEKRNAAIRMGLVASPAVHARRKLPRAKKPAHILTPEQRCAFSVRMKSNNPMKRSEVVEKMRASKVGSTASAETKAKMSATRTGMKYPIVTCPHCGKSGGAATMPRWHFANCKEIRL